jgi:cytochrome c oxidase subunit 4
MSKNAPSAAAAHRLHVEPPGIYLGVFGALLALTALTVWVAFQDLGAANNFVAMGIAGIKAILVAMFFMHLRHSSRLTKVIAATGIFWLAILIAFTLSDFFSRGLVAPGK